MALEVGSIVEGKVTGITKFGAFVELEDKKVGMVHISEVSNTYVKEIRDHLKENDVVKVKILNIAEDGKISLSIKRALPPPPQQQRRNNLPRGYRPNMDYGGFNSRKSNENMSFEDMMNKFKQTSDDKMSDLKRVMDAKRGSSRRGH